jgi:uncharacterized protein
MAVFVRWPSVSAIESGAKSAHHLAMLEMRPNCECCDKDLPADAPGAMICSFECTFCRACVEGRLGGKCPNCGGGFTARPVRVGAMLAKNPAKKERTPRNKACA